MTLTRQLAVAADLLANRPTGGFDSVEAVQTKFDAVVQTRAVVQESLNTVNAATAETPLADITFFTSVQTELGKRAASDLMNGVAISEILSGMTNVKTSYDALTDKAAVLKQLSSADYASWTQMFNAFVAAIKTQAEAEAQAAALAAVNAAEDAAAMNTALEAEDLGLVLTEYDNIDSDRKLAVAADLLANRPEGGFDSVAAVQTKFDAVVQTRAVVQASLNTVNAATADNPLANIDFFTSVITELESRDPADKMNNTLISEILSGMNTVKTSYDALTDKAAVLKQLSSADYASWTQMFNAFVAAIETQAEAEAQASALNAYNAALDAVVEADYTTESWTAYQLVVTANVMTAENTQEDVNTATSAIVAAQANLVKMPTAEEMKLVLDVIDDGETSNLNYLKTNNYPNLTMSVSDTINYPGDDYVRAGVDYRYVVNIGGTIDKVDLREYGRLETDPDTGYYKEEVMFYIPVPEGATSMTYKDGIFVEGSPAKELGTVDAPTIVIDGKTYFKMDTSFIWNTSKDIDGDWRPMVGSEPNRASYTVTFVDELGRKIVNVQLTIDSAGLTVNNVLPTVINTTQNVGYETIQAAIDAAVDGDTIEIAAGTYNESVIVPEEKVKSITILGANSDTIPANSEIDGTIITGGMTFGRDISSNPTIEKSITVKGITFSSGSGLTFKDIRNVTVENNKFIGITAGDCAVTVLDPSNHDRDGVTTISNNYIDGVAGTSLGLGIYVRRPAPTTVIEGNHIENTDHNTIQVVGVSAGPNVAINANTLINWDQNRDDDGGRAIRINFDPVDASTALTVAGNTFHPNDNAEPADPNYVKITGVSTADNNENNLIGSLIEQNTWPSETDYSTVILVNTTAGAKMAASITSGDTTNYYPSIQSAIDASEDGDTIHVAAGTYSEEVKVNTVADVKSITILGANAETVPTSNAPDGTIITGGIYIGTDSGAEIDKNVTVKGITFSGRKGLLLGNIKNVTVENNKFLNIGETFNPSTTDVAAVAVIDPYAGGTVTIENNYFDGVEGIGIYIRKPTVVNVSGNHIENTAHNAMLLAGTVTDAAVSITGNDLVNWDADNDSTGGRALRSAVAASSFIFTNNKMIKSVWADTPTDPDFVKVTDLQTAATVDFNLNYWNGENPEFEVILANSFDAIKNETWSYYTDEAMSTLNK